MSALHKGMLAFGVELDSFCERETAPQVVSIGNVGMASLTSSKLYGGINSCTASSGAGATCTTACIGAGTSAACTTASSGASCGGTGATAGSCSWTSGGSGPGKHNFIGFGGNSAVTGQTCVGTTGTGSPGTYALTSVQIIGAQGSTNTTADTACLLGISSYEMGVYGHISGNTYYGVSINNNGVVSSEVEQSTSVGTADTGC